MNHLDHQIGAKGYTISYGSTPSSLTVEEKDHLAGLAGERRKRSRSGDQPARQPSRQSASAAEDTGYVEIDDDCDGGYLEEFAQPSGYIRWQDPVSKPYVQRLQENETAWERLEDTLLSKAIEAKPSIAARRVTHNADRKVLLELSACFEQECLVCQQPLEVQSVRDVAHWGLSGYTELQLPLLHCSACSELWESVPVTYDSFGNAPNRPTVGFPQFHRLLSKKGLSASDFCAVQTDMQACGEMAAGVPLSGAQLCQTPSHINVQGIHFCLEHCI